MFQSHKGINIHLIYRMKNTRVLMTIPIYYFLQFNDLKYNVLLHFLKKRTRLLFSNNSDSFKIIVHVLIAYI